MARSTTPGRARCSGCRGITTSRAGRVAESLEVLAETGPVFASFAPYVAAIADDGTVVFTATLANGGTGVFRDGETSPCVAMHAARISKVISHPDRSDADAICFYGTTEAGEDVVVSQREGVAESYLGAGRTAGPLGPTMNATGAVAIRFTEAGRAAVGLIESGSVTVIAREDRRVAGFEGLPVLTSAGEVVFHSRLRSGGAAIEIAGGARRRTLVETGERFETLARFPAIGATGAVVFAAREVSGRQGIYVHSPAGLRCVVDGSSGFDSFRGALIGSSDEVVFFASRAGGSLGVYRLRGAEIAPVIAVGEKYLGVEVIELALNAVSINGAADLAIRLKLAGGKGLIVRSRVGNHFP